MLVSLLAPLIFAAAPTGQMTLVEIGDGIPNDWKSALQKQAEKTISKVAKAVPPPKADLANLQLLLGCDNLDAACIGEIISSSNAKTALHVRVVAREEGAALSYAVIDRNGRARRATNNYFVSRDAAGLKTAKEILSFVNDINPPTHVVVTTEDVDVFIDGKSVGRGPLSLVGKVIPGAHEIEVRRQGYDRLKQQQNVARGGTETKGFKMRKSPKVEDPVGEVGGENIDDEEVDKEEAKKMGEPLSLRSAAWPMIAVGTIVAAVGGGLLTYSQTAIHHSCRSGKRLLQPCFVGTDVGSDEEKANAERAAAQFLQKDENIFNPPNFEPFDAATCARFLGEADCETLRDQLTKTEEVDSLYYYYVGALVVGGALVAGGTALLIFSNDPTEASTSEIANAPKLHPTFVWLDKKPQEQMRSKRP